jgi:hypothetical protein
LADRPVRLTRDRDGNYYLFDYINDTSVQVFSPGGTFLHSIGREGEGPGEFRDLTAVAIGPHDTLYAADVRNRRLSVFAPNDTLIRTQHLPGMVLGMRAIGNGELLVNAVIRTAERIGYPVHHLGPDGEIRASFGADPPVFRPDMPWLSMRSVAVHDGHWLTAHTTRYRLEGYDSKGRRLWEVSPEREWFPPYHTSRPASPDHPPKPWLQDIWVDSEGRIWVLFRTPGASWRQSFRGTESTDHGEVLRKDDQLLWDSRIEVLDGQGGGLIYAWDWEENAVGFTRDGLVYTWLEDPVGRPMVQVWKLSLEGD